MYYILWYKQKIFPEIFFNYNLFWCVIFINKIQIGLMEKTIRLTESEFRNFINGIVKCVLNEATYSKDMIFVSYLNNEYNQSSFKPIDYNETSIINKCKNGLWACPIDSAYGWKEWCEREDYPIGNNLFTFKLKDTAKIYVIDDYKGLDVISTMTDRYGMRFINFKELLDNGYDGIYVSENAVHSLRFLEGDIQGLSSWDVESLCVFNPNVIIPLSQEKVNQEINPNRNHWWDDEEDEIFDEYYSTEKYNNDVENAWLEHEKGG